MLFLAMIVFTSKLAWAEETLDVLRFEPPPSWSRSEHERSIEFLATDEATGGWGKIQVWRSAASSGSHARDFKEDYEATVVRALKPSRPPKTTSKTIADGWRSTEARVSFTFAGRPGYAIFLSFSNGAVTTCAAAMFSDTAFKPEVDAFLSSLHLEPPSAPAAAPIAAPVEQEASHGRADTRLVGRWNRKGSHMPHYADPASWGTAGYTTSRYEFRDDGTYVYTERSWRSAFTRILLIKERGTYTANESELVVQPTASVIESYAKKNGVDELGERIDAKPRPLERVAYRYRFHFFTGLQEWSLVLQADQPTMREGPFSSNATYPNAWYFDQRFTNTDLTSPRGK